MLSKRVVGKGNTYRQGKSPRLDITYGPETATWESWDGKSGRLKKKKERGGRMKEGPY